MRPSQHPKPHPHTHWLQWKKRVWGCLCLDSNGRRSTALDQKLWLVTQNKSLTLSPRFFLCKMGTPPTNNKVVVRIK